MTGAVRSQPFSVLLLDEFEKADPAVFDLLLQVLGEGRLTDGRGRTANFCNCLVLLTSNLGADSLRDRGLGLADEHQTDCYQQHFENRVREFFRPEMVNRIDRIIAYRPLEPKVVPQIARQRIAALSRRDGWREAAANLVVRDDAIHWLAARGYQPKYGARPLVRTIEQRLVVPVAEELLKVMRGNFKEPAKDTLQVALVEADAGWQGSPLQVSWVAGDVSSETVWSTGGDHAERSAAPAIATAARNIDQCARLVVAWTKLRRRSQMLLQTDGYHDLKSRLTGLRRERESIRKGSSRSAPYRTEHSSPERTGKQQQRFHQLSAEENKLRNQLGQWQAVLDRIAAEEGDVLLASYRGEAFDSDASAVRLDRLKLELWEILGSLITGRSVRDEAITVVVLSPNLRAAWPLIDAYQQLASKRDFRAAAYALRPLTAESQELSAEADGEGFGVEPKAAFQLTPRISEKLWSVSNQVPADENVPPTIAAHRFRSAAVLTKYPADSLGIAFELTGYCARLLLEDERGQHVFRLSDHASAAQDVTALVETFAGPLANYQVPRQLEQRKLMPLGELRRFYKLSNQVMRDAHAKTQHSWGHSFANTLEGLLEDWLDQRIWDQLV